MNCQQRATIAPVPPEALPTELESGETTEAPSLFEIIEAAAVQPTAMALSEEAAVAQI